MTNQEILTKSIEKALSVGWKPVGQHLTFLGGFYVFSTGFGATFSTEEGKEVRYTCNDLIFNHDFAKALWGEHRFDAKNNSVGTAYGVLTHPWQYHLQQMVIDDDPIEYLGRNI